MFLFNKLNLTRASGWGTIFRIPEKGTFMTPCLAVIASTISYSALHFTVRYGRLSLISFFHPLGVGCDEQGRAGSSPPLRGLDNVWSVISIIKAVVTIVPGWYTTLILFYKCLFSPEPSWLSSSNWESVSMKALLIMVFLLILFVCDVLGRFHKQKYLVANAQGTTLPII